MVIHTTVFAYEKILEELHPNLFAAVSSGELGVKSVLHYYNKILRHDTL
jgi:hypothetical protein